MSLHQTIVEAVRDIVAGVAGARNVRVRGQAVRLKSDPLPTVLITRGEERQGPYVFGGSVMREYAVILDIRFEQGMRLENGIDDAKTLREALRKALVPDRDSEEKPLPTIPAVWDVEPVDLPAEPEADTQVGYETSRLALAYRSNEGYRP